MGNAHYCVFPQSCVLSCLSPHLSCWERQGEGVDEGAERGEARLDGLNVRRREQMQPGQEQAGTDVGLEHQSEVVELVFPADPVIPGGMGLHGGGRWELRGGGRW